ncbi:uncharacterized protein SPSK_05243 [Sporothrix schenckii 1099-18]|uniref:Uncharacterized protein n=1 Tax=Sporothrix schenckii 1099-18 TaxID=1397361 RepID=A0A0F2LWP4_SPOSC|nr:uncharacterized protein SPSK_05243 [Sporothrix schenckii 1099-18]KJR80915.1 hypothetical protein SPSK_05243 [Sporothrix schenckii 1099-18]
MARQFVAQWVLQEAITEQRTTIRTATAPVTLHLESISNSQTSSSLSSFSSFPSAPSSNRQRAGPEAEAKPSYRICIVEGSTLITEIDTSKLNPGNSEIRIVPPTRATLLVSEGDDPTVSEGGNGGRYGIGRGSGRGMSQSQTQTGSQHASQSVSQRKKRSLLKLCFLSVGDLKAASHEFMRIGLRCTSLPTRDGRTTLSRTSSVVSMQASSQGSQERSSPNKTAPGLARSSSLIARTSTALQPAVRAASTALAAVPAERRSTGPLESPLKRTYSDAPPDLANANRMKRRQTSVASQTTCSPSLLRRESSAADVPMQDARQPPPVNVPASRSLSRTSQWTASNDVDEPPPRRELPQSVTRHLSRTPSQDTRSASAHGRRGATADTEVQTAAPFVEPEVALLAGMDLFQELANLKDGMLKECLSMTKALGADDHDEAEARLVARYAIEFQTRFTEICTQRTHSFCM